MTDEARARATALVLLGESGVTAEAVATLAGEFAAVRRTERRAVVAFLRAEADTIRGESGLGMAVLVEALAAAIESGDHAAEAGS